MKFHKNRIMMASVVVRIPPPTELGEAPMNINMLNNKRVGSEKSLTFMVANPPLRVLEDINNE
jgi:hypothetical protein